MSDRDRSMSSPRSGRRDRSRSDSRRARSRSDSRDRRGGSVDSRDRRARSVDSRDRRDSPRRESPRRDSRERRARSVDSRQDHPMDGGIRDRRERNASRDDDRVDQVDVTDEDAAFVLGKQGSTKKKIARACGANLELNERELVINIRGTAIQRQRARDYVGFVKRQRQGPVEVDYEQTRDDMTVLDVPSNCVAFIMGKHGMTLRQMEEEWHTLMFFAANSHNDKGVEKLIILGNFRSRRGAELKVMSAIEHKLKSHFIVNNEISEPVRFKGDIAERGWGYEYVPLKGENFAYALGSRGETRKKLARASGCIIEYVGTVACILGFPEERERAVKYLGWLLAQRDHKQGKFDVGDVGRVRDDVLELPVPKRSVGYITGTGGEALRHFEKDSGTFMFTNGTSGPDAPNETLLIFSHSREARERGASLVKAEVDRHQRVHERGGFIRDRDDSRRDFDRRGGGGGGGGRGGYDRRGGGGYGGGGGMRGRRDDYDRRDRRRSDSRDRGGYDRRDRDYDRGYDRRDRDYDRRDDRRERDNDRGYDRRRSDSRDRGYDRRGRY
eukprot:TRINITY_DN1905_c0_g1_i1.p1 TRINITY_DN1905_c0_g1~~TRINITY_DN1905_c0_g1_i1.p1  ORF type:complete len:556 (+),score=219.31 TRINITY_DN1905_c0_g1_i1:48-1715(+)